MALFFGSVSYDREGRYVYGKTNIKISKSKILGKLRESIIEQTDSEQSEMSVYVKKLLEDVKDPDEAVKLINKMNKMIKIKKK